MKLSFEHINMLVHLRSSGEIIVQAALSQTNNIANVTLKQDFVRSELKHVISTTLLIKVLSSFENVVKPA